MTIKSQYELIIEHARAQWKKITDSEALKKEKDKLLKDHFSDFISPQKEDPQYIDGSKKRFNYIEDIMKRAIYVLKVEGRFSYEQIAGILNNDQKKRYTKSMVYRLFHSVNNE